MSSDASPADEPDPDLIAIDTGAFVSGSNVINVRQFYPNIKTGEAHRLAAGTSSKLNQNDSFKSLQSKVSTITVQPSGSEEDLFSATEVSEQILEVARQRQEVRSADNKMEDILHPDLHRFKSMHTLLVERAKEHYDMGSKLIGKPQFEKAIICLTKAVNLDPTNISTLVLRAETYLQITDFSSAILNYKRVCVLTPDSNEHYNRLALIYFLHGQCLFDQQSYAEALEAFSRAAEMRPEMVGYHMRSIACLASLHRHGECLALVNKQLDVDQNNADLFILRARLQQLFRNITLCYYDVNDALEIDGTHVEALKMKAMLEARALAMKKEAMHLNLLGRTRDALQKISIAIETSPYVAEYHIIRGALHRRLSDFNAAIDDFLLAMDKTDHDESSDSYKEAQRQLLLSYNDFAVECFLKGFYEEALILLNKAIKGEKSEKGLYINRGDCFFKEGHLEFAQADYQQALELDPTDATTAARVAIVQNEYGVQNYHDRDFQEAEFRFSMAIQHNPSLAQYYLSRARTRQLLESHDAAGQDIIICLYLDPHSTEVMSQVTRLFPGKAIAEVLSSKAGTEALKFLRHMMTNASPEHPKLDELNKYLDAAATTPTAQTASESPKHISIVPKLEACMEEREFHITIVHQKKKINAAVQKVMTRRTPLHHSGARMLPLPATMARDRARKTASGWRNYGRYVSII